MFSKPTTGSETTDKLCELKFAKLKQNVLIVGYLRKNKTNFPKNINKLCIKYTKLGNISPENDNANFITKQDIKFCEKYKKIGNNLYKKLFS